MATFTIDPNMGFPNPTPGEDPGPDYANNLQTSLTTIGAHDHSPGKGLPVTPLGLNINADLPLNGNNLTLVKTVNFVSLIAPLAGVSPNLGCIYVSGNELYYNDESGNVIPITLNGSVNSGAGSITGLPSGTASASYSGGSQTFIWRSATNTPANMDMGSAIIREVAANAKGVTLKSVTSLGTDYDLILPQLPSVPKVLTLDAAGNITTSQASGTGPAQSDVLPGFGLIPTGAAIPYWGTSAPAGYLLCDGTSYLRTDYPNLFAVIGTAAGAADGTHFNVPLISGMFVRGVSGTSGNDPDASSRTANNPGGNTGNNVGSQQDDATAVNGLTTSDPGHHHTVLTRLQPVATGVNVNNNGIVSGDTSAPVLAGDSVYPVTQNSATGVTVGAGDAETRPVNVYANYIIKT